MRPLTDHQIRASLANTSRREAGQAVLPDLAPLEWARLDYLGWHDPKRPQESYVVLEVDDDVVGIALRTTTRSGVRRKAICAWCQDVVATADVSLYVARRGGPLGRRGDSVGTLICTDFACSRNVRRTPLIEEVGSADPHERARLVEQRIEGLRTRSARFVASVLEQDEKSG